MKKVIYSVTLWSLVIASSVCNAQRPPNAQTAGALFIPAPGSPISIGSNPRDIALGDINRDGKLDIVTCNEGDTVTIFLGNGRGGFTPAPGPAITAAAHIIAIGDVNNDRFLDLATTHHDAVGVTILLGNGASRFSPAGGSPFAAHQGAKAHNHGLGLNDLNADGNLDITTSNQDDNSVSVLLGNGKGAFTSVPGSPFAVGRSPYPHAVADVNRDNAPDIVTPNVRSNNVSVLIGNGRGGFAPATGSPFTVAFRPYYVAVGDVNGDGRPDLVTTHDDVNLLSTLLGDGRGGFAEAPGSPLDLGRRAYKLLSSDLNGDSLSDLVIGTEASDSVTVLMGSKDSRYLPAAGSPLRAGRSPKVAVGDVNGDGKPDIITANSGSGDISVFLNSRPNRGRTGRNSE